MAQLIAGRYANALFELALETGKIDEIDSQIRLIYDSIKDDAQFNTILNHPQISGNEKMQIFEKAFKGVASNEVMGLFSIVIRKNRENELLNILRIFIGKVEKYKGVVTAYVYSAAPLDEKRLSAIKDRLSENLNKQVTVKAEVDNTLIGGIKINVDGHIIDGSIKKHLSDLKQRLLSIETAQ